ncbi:MAG TPA: D-glycero-beta-D-manno-heptose 1-phosphate adenylyltransferase [Rhodospirillaceae bacterium]|nr:D-glycero-beta-D-manno-heptose 1-phosphate adenylyltransferase [Rhodospirillaceae bacterium]
MTLTSRIKTADELAAIIDADKKAGKTVVTTNGVYDFLHAGHVEYLEEARALGDRLIVILNTDASVHRIKGPARPINAEQDRALVMAALRCVDYVTFMEEDDPRAILDKLKPSIHAKGGDYDIEKMPETAIVRKNGGEVKMLMLKAGYSNTIQYKRILAATEQEQGFERPAWLTAAQKDKS